ncbi:hypothetical protein RSSM_04789 [Rhodopirellula sallentina SM41]|uniref:Uncharacterized protein n=1 Tax=Rhodopirellula sallentina SM41 TaxID=1263870 RepID=M5TX30_9BACT|nr:hypothetical protein RSSM_04789 [Rhodopirellula sallentina SM41]
MRDESFANAAGCLTTETHSHGRVMLRVNAASKVVAKHTSISIQF